ncbi:hypothetical protein VTK56DRAFT_5867 [Thermocarpiscus australiensis]
MQQLSGFSNRQPKSPLGHLKPTLGGTRVPRSLALSWYAARTAAPSGKQPEMTIAYLSNEVKRCAKRKQIPIGTLTQSLLASQNLAEPQNELQRTINLRQPATPPLRQPKSKFLVLRLRRHDFKQPPTPVWHTQRRTPPKSHAPWPTTTAAPRSARSRNPPSHHHPRRQHCRGGPSPDPPDRSSPAPDPPYPHAPCQAPASHRRRRHAC